MILPMAQELSTNTLCGAESRLMEAVLCSFVFLEFYRREMFKISITLVFEFSRGLQNIYIYDQRVSDITFLKPFSSTAPKFRTAGMTGRQSTK